MTKIGLIDVDGHNFPNFALMRIAGWHRTQGHHVEWANRPVYFKSCRFEDFSPRRGFRCNQYLK